MGANTYSAAKLGEPAARYADRTIALVGLMGAGKSTVGRRLADALGRHFYDSDNEIEKAAGQSITDIFATHGEAEFRRGEKAVLKRLLEDEAPCVLATGGGAFLAEETRALMKDHAISVWLNADLETLWKRVNKRSHRPLLKTADPRGALSRLLEERTPIYAQADLTVISKDGPHSHTVDAILDALKTWSPR